ncbi:hypothetical protein P691DRAFT_803330 [Macrolepiota fuliginosa MF-IS2]|uniref:Uncharacterized protein n=1 Tax=Macrolepiota fuliginosa MF-IS2 TaxID=1400762 RepID=A0A9P5WYN6_9AGAR|nr:hypothetical protein P691DRAFT_803330 [Macrolepiota fuliginosa MF-IS2]
MVRKAFGPRSRIYDIGFIFPLCLWVITIFTGCVGGVLLGIGHRNTTSIALQTTAISSNILLNLYTTIYIAACLLLHRRMVIACIGKAAQLQLLVLLKLQLIDHSEPLLYPLQLRVK